jgi:hypothetical protein
MTTQLTSSNYSTLNTAITELMRSGTYSGVTMIVYTDSAGTTKATDSTGAVIDQLKIARVNTTNVYTDANGVIVNASIIVGFNTKSEIKSIDTVDSFWYTIEGITLVKKTF